jgi:pectin methylesterase-like acyl-CoA thioesterase
MKYHQWIYHLAGLLLALAFAHVEANHSHASGGSPSQSFASCQRITPRALEGCPPHTIYVSLTDSNADFDSVQDAIESIPETNKTYHILIAPGNYTEQLNVTRQGPLYLLGQSDDPHDSVSYSDVTYNTTQSNDVQIWWYVSLVTSCMSFSDQTQVLCQHQQPVHRQCFHLDLDCRTRLECLTYRIWTYWLQRLRRYFLWQSRLPRLQY